VIALESEFQYTIRKAHIVPTRETGRLSKYSSAEIEKCWQEFLEHYRKLVELAANNMDKCDVWDVANILYLLSKAPLYMEILREVRQTPWRILFRELLNERAEVDLITYMENEEVQTAFYQAFLHVPADTRPGANTASLLSHLWATASIAQALALERYGFDRERVAIIRIAALLHDIGKPFDWKRHPIASKDEARKLLEPFHLDDKILNKILSTIRYHHFAVEELPEGMDREVKEFVSIIAEADRFASSMDRLGDLIKRFLGDALKQWSGESDVEAAYRKLYVGERGRREELWALWEELDRSRPEELDAASERFAEELQKIDTVRTLLKEYHGRQYPERGPLKLLLFDLAGIQRFIYACEKLPAVVGGSNLIALFEKVAVLCALNRKNIPLESVLCFGGGTFPVVSPASPEYVNTIREAVEREAKDVLRDILRGITGNPPGVRFDVASLIQIRCSETDLYAGSFWPCITVDLFKKMIRQKAQAPQLKPVPIPLAEVCYYCRAWPATGEDEEGHPICDFCQQRILVGRDYHFKPKWGEAKYRGKSLREVTGGRSWGEVSRRVLEFLGALDTSIEVGEEPNIVLMLVDGNRMGLFIGSAISPSDYVERSIRVDLALKRAYKKLIDITYRAAKTVYASHTQSEEKAVCEVLRIYLGTLYMGGDDAMFILPTRIAIPAVIILMYEFFEEMGRAASLSAAFISAPAKNPIWPLRETVEQLLDEAKPLAYEIANGRGAVAFYHVDRGSASLGHLLSTLRSIRDDRLTRMPYEVQNLVELLNEMFQKLTGSDELRQALTSISGSYDDYYERLMHFFYRAALALANDRDDSLLEAIRACRRAILDVHAKYVEGKRYGVGLRNAILFILRQIERGRKESKQMYSFVYETLKPITMNERSALLDIFLILKLMGGGTR